MDTSPDIAIISEEEIDTYASARMSICRSCDNLKTKLPLCKQCKCFMPVKTRLKFASCPIGKW